MTTRILRTPSEIDGWARLLHARKLPITVSVIAGASRSWQQNRLAHKWFGQIAAHLGLTPIEAKARCKAKHGLPIMKRDNPEWVAKWEPLYKPLPYAMKLQLFECIPLTSELTIKQMGEFLDAVQQEYRPMGIDLVDPEAAKYEGG